MKKTEIQIIERARLRFGPGGREGYKWASNYNDFLVGLCRQPFCEVCNLTEREKLRDFRGGELEVKLVPYRRPTFWREEIFYLGHLIRVPKKKIRVVDVDEGIEFDMSGSNAFLYTVDSKALLVDPGSMEFNGDEFLLERFLKGWQVEAIILTHGHFDHFNHLREVRRGSFFMSNTAFQFASRHAALGGDTRLVRALDRAKRVVPGEPVLLEKDLPFKIDTIPLPHSIPETMGLVIQGRRKRVIHLADFKLTGWEEESKAKTIALLQEAAKEPVDLLSLNIINAHFEGFTPIETVVIKTITDIMAKAKGRVIITSFSTNLERIRRLAEAAKMLGREVRFFGAGMKNAKELLRFEQEKGADSKKPVIFVTGCQAEEDSVLWRIAYGEKPPFSLYPTDTLINSSRCIPVNKMALREQTIALRPKVEKLVVHEGEIEQVGLQDREVEEAPVHVSGHGYQEDLRLVLEIFKPKKALPWPQISPQIEAFQSLTDSLGIEVLTEKERVIKV